MVSLLMKNTSLKFQTLQDQKNVLLSITGWCILFSKTLQQNIKFTLERPFSFVNREKVNAKKCNNRKKTLTLQVQNLSYTIGIAHN